MNGLLFVYGTLKVGGFFAKRLDNKRNHSEPAKIKGKMFKAGGGEFPAVIIDDFSTVTGELHEYKDFNKVIEYIDMVEGYFGHKSPSNLYNRHEIEVIMDSGKTKTATIYTYARDTNNMEEVSSGVWMENIIPVLCNM